MCTDYSLGGLRVVNPFTFSQAQKMIWVKKLFDENCISTWKSVDVAALSAFHPDISILWKSNPFENVLGRFKNIQIADSIRSWHFFNPNP